MGAYQLAVRTSLYRLKGGEETLKFSFQSECGERSNNEASNETEPIKEPAYIAQPLEQTVGLALDCCLLLFQFEIDTIVLIYVRVFFCRPDFVA